MIIGGTEPPTNIPTATQSRLPIGLRVLYMVVFAVTFWILTWVLIVTVVAQLILTLLAAQPNPDLLRFGKGLSRYIAQVVEFLMFLTDRPPFPFASWPDMKESP
ncbi:MAG TPA: DUF4389 domain-containing protein [Steroidobacteraceae bacterium]|jgi:hypothetical protein|nr:DUF4389 domain-containing protein [Steroidobacteraceae bacterium]